jgi:peptidoglycan/LPS O-acetylase OafA/YrhL
MSSGVIRGSQVRDADRVPVLGGRPARANGFDTIRIIAATAVLVSHGFALTGFSEPLKAETGMTLGSMAVAVFFAISGFLIAASFARRPLAAFVAQRARRIMPGLAMAILLSVLVLGPAVTTLPPARYFRATETWRYLLGIVFHFGNRLPGVFGGQPVDGVNGSLWTLTFEVACYGLAIVLLAAGRWRAWAVVAAWLLCLAGAHFVGEWRGGVWFYLARMLELFRYFGAGMLAWLWRDRLPLHRGAAVLAGVALVASAWTALFGEAVAVLGTYALMVFAFTCPEWFRRLSAKGDISYGVYIYAFPIQQLLVPWCLGRAVPWAWNIALALPLTTMAGVLSWVCVERPALRR